MGSVTLRTSFPGRRPGHIYCIVANALCGCGRASATRQRLGQTVPRSRLPGNRAHDARRWGVIKRWDDCHLLGFRLIFQILFFSAVRGELLANFPSTDAPVLVATSRTMCLSPMEASTCTTKQKK